MILAREERLCVCQLAHDATDGPDICWLSIAIGEQEFGRSVPASRHIVCERCVLRTHMSREPEVAELQGPVTGLLRQLLAYEQVFRFHVSVDDILRMEVVHGFEELVHEPSDSIHLVQARLATSIPFPLVPSRTSSRVFSTYSKTK